MKGSEPMTKKEGKRILTNLRDLPNIIGQKVSHKIFGDGIVTEIRTKTENAENIELLVRFQAEKEVRIFQFPNAIGVYLMFTDSEKAAEVEAFVDKNSVPLEIETPKAVPELHHEKLIKKVPSGRNYTKKDGRSNVAFKMNYCDGGKTAKRLGYDGVCSGEIIKYNIEKKKRSWCSNPRCDCRRFYDGDISYRELLQIFKEDGFLCYESIVLREWLTRVGESTKGDPRTIRSALVNKLGILTTILPENEKERLIFGAFMIQEVFDGDNDNAGEVCGNQDYCLELTPKEARNVLFWDYFRNPNKPKNTVWASGLIRYFDDNTAVKILQAMIDAKEDEDGKRKARRLLSRYCEANNIVVE